MKALLTLVLAFLITGGAVVARADDSELARQSLKGLKGIAVLVESLKPEVELAGLTKASIQTDVDLKLRLAGIPVLSRDVAHPGVQYFLYVQVSFLPIPDGVWPYRIDVELTQRVLLDRDRSIIGIASTWSVGSVGRVGKENVRKFVRDAIKDRVDEFINAYLSVNPR